MIQIFGTKKCKETMKALRFFKERGIQTHFVNLTEKPVSPGELDAMIRGAGEEALLDTMGKTYSDKGLAYMDFSIREEILENNALLKTPVIREGKNILVGYDEKLLKEWYAKIRS